MIKLYFRKISHQWHTIKKWKNLDKTWVMCCFKVWPSLLCYNCTYCMGLPWCGWAVKTRRAMQEMRETQFQSLSREDPLEGGMATHSSILAWRIPWTEEPGRLQTIGSQRVGYSWNNLSTHTYIPSLFSLPHHTPLGQHRAPDWAACAI